MSWVGKRIRRHDLRREYTVVGDTGRLLTMQRTAPPHVNHTRPKVEVLSYVEQGLWEVLVPGPVPVALAIVEAL